ncbi:MAG: hypothetical protein HWE23_07560 [Rhodobacteraceae bacterium]|nr:hypothetical protein [Paracoccaceae bacterium]
MRRKRPFQDETHIEEEPRTPFQPPVIAGPRIEREHEEFIAFYMPDASFMAHLIAARDQDTQTLSARQSAQELGSDQYRQTAASPRKRRPGHVIAVDF